MQIEALLKSFIYLIAGSLLVPTLILLCLILVWLLFFSGGFFSEWIQRRRQQASSTENRRQKVNDESFAPATPGPVTRFAADLSGLLKTNTHLLEAEVENLLQQTVQTLYKPLDHIRLIIRIGPGLGLIGTLIPMGTGLAALSQGDLTRLSADLVIAFTTTVLGLSEGMAAYFLYTVKHRWVREDVRAMEFMTEIMVRNRSTEQARSMAQAPSREERSCGL